MHGTTPPLSKLPLQFSFLVDPPAPSCVDGLYLPKFVHPTPENGQHINAEVNKEVEIRVRAQASHATLHDIIISGPLNITKHRSTHGDFVIRWTPGPDDVGDHYPICFAVESVIDLASTLPPPAKDHVHVPESPQSGIYQSEMRCVLVNIGQRLIESHVTCHESSMTVEVTRSSLPGLHEDHLRLNDPSNTACNLQTKSNSSHIIAVVPLNACGTQIEEDEENLVFKNEITTVDNIHDLITRNHLLEVQFYCQYPKRGNVTQGFTAHRRNVVVWDKGFGKFTYEFEFYPNSQYGKMVDPGLYPLEYDVTERIYMQIEAKSTVNNTQLFVESCSAAPYDTPNYWPTYSIIENGCTVDQTVQVHPKANPREFRFSMEAFQFIGLHDQVYISCSVLMCEAGSSGTRCSQGCINSPLTGHHHHRKREAITQSARHFISQGPLRLKRSAESTGSPGTPMNLNLVFIVGCLLAAVGMISAVALYKVRASKIKYQPLASFEN
ncbi:CUB and zona pellucida-like domain-containing protein 1 [Gymnodraco acuticeps]|uniref:CUB and zona pellucida-like domain-containing protein 1 n=1 Tax=Gymnodraco acuticeps TaxID=8218 RepID=A0A6P8TG31_GYMAC|nr:CUB and zona pellucida-like domain-containing protein 1 [Gymnodraco acuticeps]